MPNPRKLPPSPLHWQLLGVAWVLVILSFFVPVADANAFLRWRTELFGFRFHSWLISELPSWILAHSKGFRVGYVSMLDILWFVNANISILAFVFTPIIFWVFKGAGSLIVWRCLSLILLTFPITVFLPARLNFPQPLLGMYFVAAAHLLTLIVVWLPRRDEKIPDPEGAFMIQTNESVN